VKVCDWGDLAHLTLHHVTRPSSPHFTPRHRSNTSTQQIDAAGSYEELRVKPFRHPSHYDIQIGNPLPGGNNTLLLLVSLSSLHHNRATWRNRDVLNILSGGTAETMPPAPRARITIYQQSQLRVFYWCYYISLYLSSISLKTLETISCNLFIDF
jgi:hypothetical protein